MDKEQMNSFPLVQGNSYGFMMTGQRAIKTVYYPSPSHFTTDGQSVRLSWCRAPSGDHDQILVTV
jgi:hypothetical protein